MEKESARRVNVTDRMVLIGIGLGAVYWFIETFLYVISSYETFFSERLLGPDFHGLCTRIIVLCLFLIFGSHAQYTINKQKETEAELEALKATHEKLKNEILALRKR
ncbi:MAG: hypothetical protein JRI75_07795 [Deltaproteobacteria bacterium]|jgi:hypothetical protein|nr:hypothetical protein [Deltaproteobacteria bacterium]